MTVYCRQVADGEKQEYVIAPHADDQTDMALLLAKANGAADKGWTVDWLTPTSFSATKVRWGGVTCVRTFEVE